MPCVLLAPRHRLLVTPPFLSGGRPAEPAVSRFHVRWYPVTLTLPRLFPPGATGATEARVAVEPFVSTRARRGCPRRGILRAPVALVEPGPPGTMSAQLVGAGLSGVVSIELASRNSSSE